EIESGAELSEAVGGLIRDPRRAAEIGRRARQCSEAQSGAAAAAAAHILRLQADAAPRIAPALPVGLAVMLWHAAAAVARVWRTSRMTTLRTPVISVGNLTVGGSGKTPMTLYLAERFSKPAILTRGYGRQSSEDMIFPPGAEASLSQTGDEAQIFLRSRVAPVGLGADRAKVGRLLEQRFDLEHIILDDGFQHWRLDRQVDVV